MNKKFKSGFVTIVGRPNVGKSTLINSLIGEKIAITSNKPQTTRNKILSILTKDDCQIIFIDTPGIHKPKSKLGDFMNKSIDSSLKGTELILYLVEPREKISEQDLEIIERFKKMNANVFLVINKIDTIPKEKLLSIIEKYKDLYEFKEIIPISAYKGENVDSLIETIKRYLPEGPRYFPDDMITDQPERHIVSEIIREKILHIMQEEIPHGIAVEILSMKKREDRELVDIEANIYCERDSHKGMIIGKQGAVLKEIGTRARFDIERLLGSPTNLKLWVKVKKDWRNSDFYLKNFGYDSKKI